VGGESMRRMLKHLMVREHGQGLAEYAFLMVLIALLVMGIITSLGDHVNLIYNDITNLLP
ncbi:MAG: Flp family type IVb pilin, partial [Candidatus Saccharibacteria bacterium]